jgi:hypothetical protein
MDFESAVDPQFWRSTCPDLSITLEQTSRDIAPLALDMEQHDENWRSHLVDEGYLQFNNAIPATENQRLRDSILSVIEKGWPPVCAFVYDEFWNFFHSLRELTGSCLEAETAMLPDFWIWHVDPATGDSGWGPHRDRNINTLSPNGMPMSATVWVTLTEANPLNGCMYLVPANQDPSYRQFNSRGGPTNPQSARALCAPEGSVLLWNQHVFHWGGRSCDRTTAPRISMAFEFQRTDIEPYRRPLLSVTELPPFRRRLMLIATQILQYRHMYQFSDDIVAIANRILADQAQQPNQ